MRPRRFSTKKVLATIGALGTAAAMAGLGTFATFTSSTSAGQSVASGTVVINLGAAGTATNRLTLATSNIAAGDTMQRAVDLVNTGTVNLASITLTTSASPSTALDTDVTNGLQMVIDKCSTAWTESGSSPAYTYSCGGTTTSVLVSRPIVGSAIALSNMSLSAATDHLRVTLTLPSASTLQGLSSTLSYAFTATQRTATNA